jgi:ubiquinone/menaquinone biosynthesis C-methylase UbiE
MGWYEDSLFGPIAVDIAAHAPAGAAVLEVGCGSGALSVRLARDHGLTVSAIDVDPGEIRRARERASRAATRPGPRFQVADVASLPFEDGSFDRVVSTFSMHHWDDKAAGLAEIRRVLRPDGRALIWDTRRGFSLFHLRTPDPLAGIPGGPLELRDISKWAWPFGFTFFRRLELARPDREA